MRVAKNIIVLFAVAGLFICTSLNAQKKKSKLKKVDATKTDVQKFIKIFPLFLQEFSTIKAAAPSAQNPTIPTLAEMYSKAGIDSAKVEAFAKKNGYKNLKSFEKINTAIMYAFASIEIEKALKKVKTQAAGVPPQMRPMIEAQLKPIKKQLKAMKKQTSKKTRKNVKPFAAQIKTVLDTLAQQKQGH